MNREETVALGQKSFTWPSHKDHKVDMDTHHHEIATLSHQSFIWPSHKDPKVDMCSHHHDTVALSHNSLIHPYNKVDMYSHRQDEVHTNQDQAHSYPRINISTSFS